MNEPTIIAITGKWHSDNKSISKTAEKLLNILCPISKEVITISSNIPINNFNSKHHGIVIKSRSNNNSNLLEQMYTSLYKLKVTVVMIQLILSQKIDIIIFCFGADLFLIPIIVSRIFAKKTIIRTDSRPSVANTYKNKRTIKYIIYRLIERINYSLAHIIISEAQHMINYYELLPYTKKIEIGTLYVEDYFFMKNNFNLKKYDIGFIGRFSEEKGFSDFIESLKEISQIHPGLNVLIIGDGNLKYKLKELSNYKIEVNYIGWIEKQNLPQYLSKLKFLILPSYKEGLPNIVLEAMACGTVVLATPVGGIPDLLKDKKTGFSLKDNSPECITKNVLCALNCQYTHDIISSAHYLMEQKYSYQKVLDNYQKIIADVISK
ncbi:glycosyltransferase family 4 protein [Methanogenium sp. MK-MG]|uniref:glycosyltransferase family 4 protein n=1 Tax=Methanogenium sp. MK-MG TaxID=2599926 RepID=UPI0013ED8C7B|nr:glycosyltransferase family 4 protein [Methanogenium sp. MK-MG]KAF1079007.1 Glycosyltransferase Gtf1 [Methanogenium sp. MK-MG]